MDCYVLNDGTRIPMMGFGTYQVASAAPIRQAIDAGYRFFDTASLRILGTAIRESGIPRDAFTVETKLWIDEMDDPEKALDRRDCGKDPVKRKELIPCQSG